MPLVYPGHMIGSDYSLFCYPSLELSVFSKLSLSTYNMLNYLFLSDGSFLYYIRSFYFMSMFSLHVFMCTYMCVCCPWRLEEGILFLRPGVAYKMAVSHCVDSVIEPGSSARATIALNHRTVSLVSIMMNL